MQDFYEIEKLNIKDFYICDICDGEIIVKNKDKGSQRKIHVVDALKVATMVSKGQTHRNAGKQYGMKNSTVAYLINKVLLELVVACEKDNRVIESLKNNKDINSFIDVKNLYNFSKYFSQRRNLKNKDRIIDNDMDEMLVKKIKKPRTNQKTFIKAEESFLNRTGRVDRVIKACNYFNEGFNILEISKMKDINASNTTVRLDVFKRISELYNIYEKDEYIRLTLKEKCGIESKEQLEEIKTNTYNNMMLFEEKRSDCPSRGKRKVLINEMVEIIINGFENNNTIVSIEKVTMIMNEKYDLKMTINTVSYYLKSVLPNSISKDKYKKIIDIWAKSNRPQLNEINSYSSKLNEKKNMQESSLV